MFVNAWNEWAEGAVLEPDQRLGHAWLQATRSALQRAAGAGRVRPARPCVVVHAWDADAFDEILSMLGQSGIDARLVVTTSPEREASVRARLDARGMAAEIEVRDNRGRDILPFLHVANRLLDEGEDVVLWSGVSPLDFSTLTVTEEAADGDQASSGRRVLVGTVPTG